MRAKKFNFGRVMFGGVMGSVKANDPTAHISKIGQITISKAANQLYGFDGQLVDIVWDPEKRAMGFRKVEMLGQGDWTQSMRLLKADENGQIKFSIGRIMTVCGIEKNNYKRLLIEEYHDQMEKRKIQYLVIPQPEITTGGVAEYKTA